MQVYSLSTNEETEPKWGLKFAFTPITCVLLNKDSILVII